jgi:hypothetical protein
MVGAPIQIALSVAFIEKRPSFRLLPQRQQQQYLPLDFTIVEQCRITNM